MSGWLLSLSWIPSLVESSDVNIYELASLIQCYAVYVYKLVDFPKIFVIEIVTLSPKVPFHRLSKKLCFVCVVFGSFVV